MAQSAGAEWLPKEEWEYCLAAQLAGGGQPPEGVLEEWEYRLTARSAKGIGGVVGRC